MSVYEIPLSPEAQSFSITIANVNYNMTIKWNTVAFFWVLDIYDDNDAPILTGVPLVTGADLLAQYGYMNFNFKLIAQTDVDLSATPTYANLGISGHLYAVTTP